MERIKCTLSYDGTNFSGYQVQPTGRTVQAEVEKSLEKIHKSQPIRVVASGRTDAGVHALGQVIHFDSPLTIPALNWKKALNTLLPSDVQVRTVEKVSDHFHARYDVVEKEYRYFVLNTDEDDVFARNHTFHIKTKLDVDAMKEACAWIEGEHDFSSFCAANSGVKGEKIRTIFQASLYEEDDRIVFIFSGSGFLYNMVRILVGTLVEIGLSKRKPSEMKEIVASKDRSVAGKTAPPQGLFLWKVVYNSN